MQNIDIGMAPNLMVTTRTIYNMEKELKPGQMTPNILVATNEVRNTEKEPIYGKMVLPT